VKGSSKRTLAIVGLSAALLVAILGNWRPGVSIAAQTSGTVPKMVLATEVIYRQGDPSWSREKIGGSGQTLGSVGCTICCVCNALAEYGITLNPAELNERLKSVGGYTDEGRIKWKSVETVTDQRVQIEIPRWPMQSDINSALNAGCPVLVKVLLGDVAEHWVLLVGRDGREYLMKDPLGDGKSLAYLSSLNSDIKAIRIVRKQ
jgi:hypothetical protein